MTSVEDTPDGVEVTDGNGVTTTYDAVIIATHPDQALSMLADPTSVQRETLAAMPYSPNTALLHTDTSLLPRSERAQGSWNFLRPASSTDSAEVQVTVTYDLTRLMRLPTKPHYLVTLGGEDLVDPETVIARREYAHPIYNPVSVAAQRRLPECNTQRIAFAGAYHGWGFHEDGARSGLAAATHLGLPWTRTTREPPEAGPLREPTIRHTRRTPFKRTFEHASTMWLVDVDDLPDHDNYATFEARDRLGSPEQTIRDNVEAFLADNGVLLGTGERPGTILMAAQPRSLGYAFNPISVLWCFDAAGDQAAVVVEVHNTYGDRHAYLVHPDQQGRAQTAKAMYVSPFHGVDGTYDIAVPIPDRPPAHRGHPPHRRRRDASPPP